MISQADSSEIRECSAEATALSSSSDHDLRIPCFCEENAWRVAYRHLRGHHIVDDGTRDEDGNGPNTSDFRCSDNGNNGEATLNGWKYYVVIISNEERRCPMFMQRAGSPEPENRGYVCWDYHVIVLRGKTTLTPATEVLDIDTRLTPHPCTFETYIEGTFPHCSTSSPQLDPKFLPMFR